MNCGPPDSAAISDKVRHQSRRTAMKARRPRFSAGGKAACFGRICVIPLYLMRTRGLGKQHEQLEYNNWKRCAEQPVRASSLLCL
ncbi:MAG: hypothetical protein IKR48_03915 [Kiritimatiellae bacterium]|nr:hypothetical protein [Kiritimatiellia bacterium]